LAWKTLNRIGTKRLIPFLPDLLETLEEQGHVQLSQEHRNQLLSMSVATADRLLQAHRYTHPHGLSSTKAGPLLKQQIPIRTYAQWDEAKPGFLEVDLVTHCGGRLQGGCLYTITLTDIATGWTECLPLLNRGREAVLAALQRAQRRFPFPILGLDTDNGAEFINEEVAAYCVREQITFTRGRPYEKQDQCFVEQKNGVVVRQVVGHGRLIGEHAYRQLDELYRALHWYVNGFQPSMKLMSKQIEGRKVHRIYDAAKTPLQRVLLSGVLTSSRQQELRTIGKAFDPLRLFQQVEQLQQAIFRCEAGKSRISQPIPTPSLVPFDLAGCAAELVLEEESEAGAFLHEGQESAKVLDWRRTSKDPFAGQWEQILSWVQANPTRSGGDILRELQHRFPGRYEHSHLRTLQRGVRKIRAYTPQTHKKIGSPQELQENVLSLAEPEPARSALDGLVPSSLPVCEETLSADRTLSCSSNRCQKTEVLSPRTGRKTRRSIPAVPTSSQRESGQVVRRPATISSRSVHHPSAPKKGQRLTIERAIQKYLQAHRKAGHRPKTLEWHQMVLSHLHQYLRAECHLFVVHQITETIMRNWLTSLAQTPTPRGSVRSVSTIETYARSARAFCSWLVERGTLPCSPLSESAFPRTGAPLPHVVSPASFDQVMRAGFSQQAKAPGAKRLAVRDQALLWVLFDTGITVSELCALRVADLDHQTGLLHVRGKGERERQLTFGPTCLSHLRVYLRQMDPTTKSELARRKVGGDPLFCSKQKQSLTRNGVTMVFARFRKRAGISEISFSPQSLRHGFVLRYLQAGGNPRGLQELLGYEGMAPVRQYLRWYDQLFHKQTQQEIEVM
ncbi:MAG TPA: tyrosine-type recombinase/integrase, partial [Ktedonobacteraceae bacterium]|nr:tyrosine-type recombinase/integrase [Ktedonobacteraceae bacterium]